MIYLLVGEESHIAVVLFAVSPAAFYRGLYVLNAKMTLHYVFGRQCPPVVSSFELLCRFLSALYSSGEYEKCLPPTSKQYTHAYAHTHSPPMFVRLKSEGE